MGWIRPKRIHLEIPQISPRHQHISAGLHAADTAITITITTGLLVYVTY